MMDNLNLKPKSPDEVKTMMWTGRSEERRVGKECRSA